MIGEYAILLLMATSAVCSGLSVMFFMHGKVDELRIRTKLLEKKLFEEQILRSKIADNARIKRHQ